MGANESQPNKRIVLLGKTGDGKSSAGNTILKKQVFVSKASPESVTAECVSGDRKVYGKKITVIDTPGIMDTGLDEEIIKSEIIRSVIECAPGPDVITIVLKVGRYTAHEMQIVDKIVEYCGEDTFKHSVVLFTHGEQLEGQTIEEFVKLSPKLQGLVDKCGGHSHVIDSKYWTKRHVGYKSNRVQVKNLIKAIEQKLKDNENSCYTNELLQMVEEDIQEEMKNINEEKMAPEEKREVAKKIVHKKLLVRLAGVTTGTLTGAFLGVGVAVASVVALLKAASIAGAAAAAGATGLAAGTAGSGIAAGVTGLAAGTAGSGIAAGVTGLAAGTAGSGIAAGVTGLAAGTAGSGIAAGVTGAGVGAAGSGIGAGIVGVGAGAAGSGVAVGVIFGAAAFAGAIGGGVTGYKAAEDVDSVSDAIRNAAKLNYENAKAVVKMAEKHQHKFFKKKQN